METLEFIYRDKRVVAYIRKRVDEVSHIITNVDKLEESIYKQLVAYYKIKPIRSIKRVHYLIDREIGVARKRYRLQQAVAFSELEVKKDFGESQGFEPQDILANVEEAVMKIIETSSINKKIAGLASDELEKFTLNAWANGLTDTEISRTLASQFGGKFDKHRKSVQRFRAKCQRKLLA